MHKSSEGQDSLIGLYIGEGSYLAAGNHTLIPESDKDYAYTEIENFTVNTNQIENEVIDFDFFPNPTKNSIEFSHKMNKVEIYSTQGRLIIKKNNVLKLDLSDLSSGNYIVVLNEKHHKELIIYK